MKTYLEYTNNVENTKPNLPFRLRELLTLVCTTCIVTETDDTKKIKPIGSYTICDSFTKFLHEFNSNFRAISFNLNSPDLFGNTVEYKTVDDVHKFVNQVVELIKLLSNYHTSLIPIVEENDVLVQSWKKTITCYNNMAITLNSFSSEFFTLIKNSPKDGTCKTMDILGNKLLMVFNGEMLVPTINYTGTYVNQPEGTIEEIQP